MTDDTSNNDPESDEREPQADDAAATNEGTAEEPSVPEIESSGEPARPSGTILIPAGFSRLPDSLRPSPAPEPTEPDADAPDANAAEDEPTAAQSPTPTVDLTDAFAAAAARPSVPPVAPAAISIPAYGNSFPPGVSLQPGAVDPEGRQVEIAARRKRRRIALVAGGLSLAVILIVVAAALAVSKKKDSSDLSKQQVLNRHELALQTIEDANAPIVAALPAIAAADAPDMTGIAAIAAESRALFDGLIVPAPDGDQVQLARNLQNAITAEQGFLDELEEFSKIEVASVQQADADNLVAKAAALEDSLRASYADQPTLQPPDLSSTAEAVRSFATALATKGEATRVRAAEVAAELADLNDYAAKVEAVFVVRDRLRTELENAGIGARTIATSSDAASAASLLSAASDARYALADQLEAIPPHPGFESSHSLLVSGMRELGRVVLLLRDAVYDADCSYYYEYEGDSTACLKVNETDYYNQIYDPQDDTATGAFDNARNAFNLMVTQAREALQ